MAHHHLVGLPAGLQQTAALGLPDVAQGVHHLCQGHVDGLPQVLPRGLVVLLDNDGAATTVQAQHVLLQLGVRAQPQNGTGGKGIDEVAIIPESETFLQMAIDPPSRACAVPAGNPARPATAVGSPSPRG